MSTMEMVAPSQAGPEKHAPAFTAAPDEAGIWQPFLARGGGGGVRPAEYIPQEARAVGVLRFEI